MLKIFGDEVGAARLNGGCDHHAVVPRAAEYIVHLKCELDRGDVERGLAERKELRHEQSCLGWRHKLTPNENAIASVLAFAG